MIFAEVTIRLSGGNQVGVQAEKGFISIKVERITFVASYSQPQFSQARLVLLEYLQEDKFLGYKILM